MSCGAPTTFRLLDERVGWDQRPDGGLAGVVVSGGALELAPLDPRPPVLRPPNLARACEDCSWWLGGPGGLLRLGPCDDRFARWRDVGRVRAVAARGRHVAAVTDDALLVFDVAAERLVGRLALPSPTAVSLTPWGRVLAGDANGMLHETDLSGLPCGRTKTGAAIAQIAHPPAGECRTVLVHDDGSVSVVCGDAVREGRAEDLAALAPTGVAAATECGFCLAGRGCFAWTGAQLDAAALGEPPARHVERGQYLSDALDSGVARCRWHRIRVDADVPDGATLEVAVATTDGPPEGRPFRSPAPGAWSAFPAGDPHPDDWFEAGGGVVDATLRTAPGRYAYVRVRLTGDGAATPAVHQIRLDLPRRTSLDDLPAVYSEDALARDFSERYLSLFDAALEERDEVIARRDALLDADALPDDALAWLAGLLGTGFEAEMPIERRRAFLRAAPELLRLRGTPRGLVETLAVALGVAATVEELGPDRPWGAVGGARLDSVRLFGSSRARMRLGTSRLGTAPMNTRGNPDDDARLAGVNRARVHVGPGADRALVERVVRSQTPAHVAVSVHAAEPGLALTELRVGIDTALVAPPPAVAGLTRLGRGALRAGRSRRATAVVGRPLIVGSNTRTE